MAPFKILELQNELSLSSRHMNLYFQNRKWPGECVPLVGRSADDLLTWLPYVQAGARALRFPLESSATIVQHFPRLPTDVRWLETTDTLMFESEAWWPRLFLYETLRKIIVHRCRHLNVSFHSYIIGATRAARVTAATLANLGFRHINLIDEDEKLLAQEVGFLRRYLLGIQIDGVPASGLTMQTQVGSMMVNTAGLKDGSAILKDLSYFNFMNQGAVVVDLSECSIKTRLLQEAERADLQVLTGLEVQSQVDVDLLSRICPGQYLTFDDYYESFGDNLAQLKNSPSV